MRNWLVLGMVGAAFGAGTVAGCGGDDETDGSGGGGGEPSASSSSTGGPTTATGSTASSTGSSMGDGNDTFETAEDTSLSFDNIAGELDPTGDIDFYKFDGIKGQAVYIDIDAQSLGGVSFDDTYIDVVVTLFDGDEKQIAENTNASSNDADPRLYTILPADGTYYLRVTECFTWADDTSVCGGSEDKDVVGYDLTLAELDPADDQNVEEAEPNETAAQATPMTYSKYDDTSYYVTFAWGEYASPTDVDTFSFNPPADVTVEGRTTVRFDPTLAGTDGNGSSTSMGKVQILDPLNPTIPLASIDATKGGSLWVPLTLGQDYLLTVEHPGDAMGPHDFYFFLHNIRGSNPIEKEEVTNDVLTTAEVLTGEMNGTLWSYFLDGDIIGAGVDVDHYKVDVTAISNPKLAVSCGSRFYGSGLRDFTWAAFAEDGTPLAGATATEPDDDTAYKGDNVIPTGATNVIVKMSATQDPAVSSTFYHCGIHLVP